MADKSPEKKYYISDSHTLENLLVEHGWINKPFSGLDIPKNFTERPLLKGDISALAGTLNNLKTKFEANAVLNSLIRGDLVAEIGETYTFRSLQELYKALDQRDVKYPKSYLEQQGSSFVINFGAPRSLTKDKYEKLITDLAAITNTTTTADANRGEIIRTAFNEAPIPIIIAPTVTPIETTPINQQDIKALKVSLDKEAKTPFTITSLNTTFDKLKEEKNPDNRAVITSYIWSKLNNAGYSMTINNGIIILNHTTDKSGSIDLQTTIQSNIVAKIVTLPDFQRAMIVGPNSFGKYLETQTATPALASTAGYTTFIANRLSIDITKGTPDEQIRRINSSIGTPEEKSLLVSYVNGGLKNYNITPEIHRQIEISKIATEIKASPVAQAVVAQVNTISNGGVRTEAVRMIESNEKLTVESFMNNPASAISKYPWTSLALVIGGIWQFGFMKTIGGLLFGAIGIKAINEIGGDTEIAKQLKKAGTELFDTATTPTATTTGNIAPVAAINTQQNAPVRTPSQEQGYQAMKGAEPQINASIEGAKKRNPKHTGTFNQYEEFIRSTDFQSQKLSGLIFTSEPKNSIFTPHRDLSTDLRISLPTNLEETTLKLVLRAYMGIGLDASGMPHTADWGKAEKDVFINKVKINDSWKDKTVSELTTKIYT